MSNKSFVLLTGIQANSPDPEAGVALVFTQGVIDEEDFIVSGSLQELSIDLEHTDSPRDVLRKVAASCRTSMEDPALEIVFLNLSRGVL